MSPGPESAGILRINEYGKQHFNGVLTCCWTETKGRIVHADRDFAQGDIILSEPPLHVVQEDKMGVAYKKLVKLCKQHKSDFDYEPLWYWCALQSLVPEQLADVADSGLVGTTQETQDHLLLLHHDEVFEASVSAQVLCQEFGAPSVDPIIMERLIQIWVLNCFEYSDKPQGYSTYFFSSFMSHSCFPNAIWYYQQDNHVLRARRDIRAGDEVCISYLTEDTLLQAAAARRWDLHETKQFWCECERCTGTADTSRGFFCSKCGEPQVFSRTPVKGQAKDASLLAADLVGILCGACGQKVTKKEAERLAAQEQVLKKTLDQLDRPSDGEDYLTLKKAGEIEKLINSTCSQHVLADLMWEKLIEFYEAKGRCSDQRRLLERRCDFHAAAYPGLSAAHAWVLEARGDALRSVPEPIHEHPANSGGRGKGRGAARWQAVVKAEPKEAERIYAEALEILQSMFGDGHEYVTGLKGKHIALQRLLKEERETDERETA